MSSKLDKSVPISARFHNSRWRLAALLLAICGSLVIWAGSRSSPADSTVPLVLHGSVRHTSLPSQTFRVGTFNIHGGKGDDGERDLVRTADCLRNLDFVGLYEVHASLSNQQSNQAAILGRELNMAGMFAPTVYRWWHDCFGNALLTHVALDNCYRIPLPGTVARRARNAVLASFKHRGKTVRILLTHLDTRTDREVQLKVICDLFLALEEPAILMGDLNTTESDPQLEQLLNSPGVVDAVKQSLGDRTPENRIDWIITRGLRCVSAEYEPTVASDHPVVRAELELLAPSRQQSPTKNNRAVDVVKKPGLPRLK